MCILLLDVRKLACQCRFERESLEARQSSSVFWDGHYLALCEQQVALTRERIQLIDCHKLKKTKEEGRETRNCSILLKVIHNSLIKCGYMLL
jgi:hypothetical protein